MAARSSPMIQAARSPAIRPSGPTQIDPNRIGDYPVVLGEKLNKRLSREAATSSDHFYGIRYNYRPKHTSTSQKTTIRRGKSEKTFDLTIEDAPEGHEAISFKYRGSIDPRSSASAEDETTLALVFDQEKQVFVVEPISAELNFNLVSGPGQLRQYPKLPLVDGYGEEADEDGSFGDGGSSASDEEPPDDDNPYDYRHFIDQARNAVAISTPRLGTSPSVQPQTGVNRLLTTSKPGASTSPALASVTKAKPRPVPSTNRASTTRPTAKAGAGKSKASTSATGIKSMPKASAVITASDEESEKDEPPPRQKPRQQPQIRAAKTSTGKGYSSPHIVIDEASGLEIDMGSPPPMRRSRSQIDPSAFASRSPSRSVSRSPAPASLSADGESDKEMTDVQGHEDSDIEPIRLPPPRADTRKQSSSSNARRISVEAEIPVADEEEDDDVDDMAFADLMEQELRQAEEESEISEEE